MLRSIRLQNFKAHRDTTVPLERFTILVGPNGTGKTSVLEALLGALDTLNSVVFAGYRLADLHNSAHLGPIGVAIEGDDHGTAFRIVYEAALAVPEQGHYACNIAATYGGELAAPAAQGVSRDLGRARAAVGEVVPHHFLAAKIAGTSAPQAGMPGVSDDGGNVATVLAALKLADDDRFARIESELKRIVPNVERVRLRRIADNRGVGDRVHLDFRGAPDLPAYLASEGTLITLALLTSICTASGPRTILLDDLGISLHPLAQIELVRQIKRLLDELPDVQVIATTHSSFVLDELEPSAVQVFALRPDGSVATRPLSEHPEAQRMKGTLSAGQLWTLDPEERWVLAGGA